MKFITSGLVASAIILLSGCASTTIVDTSNDTGRATASLDYRDFESAASRIIQDIVSSGRLKKPGGERYVVSTGKIVNDTTQRINTHQLMAKVEEELMNSGMVAMTSAMGAGDSVDSMISDSRELRADDEFNQATIAKKGQLIAAELNFSGKIQQREVAIEGTRKKRIEYYFRLTVTDLTTGLRYWQREVPIIKETGKKTKTW